jgi:maltose alpha-D-glucosyltransferase / alpha-amylase
MERLIRRRKECPEIGWGRCTVLESGQPAVLTHCCDWEARILAAHNLSDEPCRMTVKLPGRESATGMVDLLGDQGYREIDGAIELELEGYGYRWLQITAAGQKLRL